VPTVPRRPRKHGDRARSQKRTPPIAVRGSRAGSEELQQSPTHKLAAPGWTLSTRPESPCAPAVPESYARARNAADRQNPPGELHGAAQSDRA
jgi:hypothetical protein